MGKRFVMAADFKGHWPFPMEDGVLSCDGFAVTLTVGGVVYALNGPAKTLAHSRGWADPDDVWRESEEPLWKAIVDSKILEDDEDAPVLRVDMSPLISAGLELCSDEV